MNPVVKFFSSLSYWMLDKLYNNNTYSDLYKVLFAQMCPSCKVMIVRLEGCKFMECGKCKFQFCWLCLSEFYTEYHYYYSLCPLRIVPIYGVVALCTLFLLLKIGYTFPIIWEYFVIIFSMLFTQIYSAGLTMMTIASGKLFIQSRRAANLLESKQKKQGAFFLLGGIVFMSLLLYYGIGRFQPNQP